VEVTPLGKHGVEPIPRVHAAAMHRAAYPRATPVTALTAAIFVATFRSRSGARMCRSCAGFALCARAWDLGS